MSDSLAFIDKSLSKYWSAYPDFQSLQSRFEEVKALLAEGGDGDDVTGARQLSDRVKVIDDMLRRYQVNAHEFMLNFSTLIFRFDMVL